MFGILFFALFAVLWVIYLVSLLFASTFGIIPRLILAIILILIFSFIIKNFWAIAGVIILISLAFWIRSKILFNHVKAKLMTVYLMAISKK